MFVITARSLGIAARFVWSVQPAAIKLRDPNKVQFIG
jgi:hypothetical protein